MGINDPLTKKELLDDSGVEAGHPLLMQTERHLNTTNDYFDLLCILTLGKRQCKKGGGCSSKTETKVKRQKWNV